MLQLHELLSDEVQIISQFADVLSANAKSDIYLSQDLLSIAMSAQRFIKIGRIFSFSLNSGDTILFLLQRSCHILICILREEGMLQI